MYKPDRLDWKIIALLNEDGRMPSAEIARKLGNVSARTITNRMNALTERAIVNIRAVVNLEMVGHSVMADVYIEVGPGRVREVAFQAAEFPQSSYVACAKILALRMSYVGELGWELYVPSEFAPGVFDALLTEGEKFGLRLVGLHAVDSLRLEKGYRHWGSDITPDDTPFEAGLGFAVKLDRGDFIGRAALIRQHESGLTRKLVMLALDTPEPLLYHDEAIYRNGELVSSITHGAFAHLLGRAMGMGYLENPEGVSDEWIQSGKYEIDVEGELIPAKVFLKAPYDPSSKRVRM